MPMYSQQGQINVMNSANFYEASCHSNFANLQQDISYPIPSSSSVINCQYSLPQISMPMTDQHGQISGIGSANYFSHSNRENLPHNSSAMFPAPFVTEQVMPMHNNIYGRNNDVSVNYFDSSFGTPNTNRL
jgi:hypothetical protein